MENQKSTNRMEGVTLFIRHITLFSGGLFWLIIGLIVLGEYQVGWKRAGSVNETVINQVNTQALVEKMEEDRLRDEMTKTRKGR